MTQILTIALFGEAEKGEFHTPYYFNNLTQLVDGLGEPPPNTQGVYCAVQAIMYQHDLIFFRVEEEGFSQLDYLAGLQFLNTQKFEKKIVGLCLPGVGDIAILEAAIPFCIDHHAILMTNTADLYDYLTSKIA